MREVSGRGRVTAVFWVVGFGRNWRTFDKFRVEGVEIL